MSSNAGTIASFLHGKGLTDPQVAGVLGNLQVESGLNPSSYNAKEGAIGLAQWEHGRRTALQSYARARGGKETDLGVQLGYLWAELTGGYSGALSDLKKSTTPAQAATIWDAEFEHSAGTTRADRIAAANRYAATGWDSGGVLSKIGASDPLGVAGGLSKIGASDPLGLAGGITGAAGAVAGDLNAMNPTNIGASVTKAGVYLAAFTLGGVLLVLGLNKATGNPAGKIAGGASHLPIPV